MKIRTRREIYSAIYFEKYKYSHNFRQELLLCFFFFFVLNIYYFQNVLFHSRYFYYSLNQNRKLSNLFFLFISIQVCNEFRKFGIFICEKEIEVEFILHKQLKNNFLIFTQDYIYIVIYTYTQYAKFAGATGTPAQGTACRKAMKKPSK